MRRLNRNSSPSSKSWMHDSVFSKWFCRSLMPSTFLFLVNTKDCNATSNWKNSLSSVKSEQATLLGWISLEMEPQLFDFDCVVSEINCNIVWNVDRVATSTFCNKLIKPIVWWSLFVVKMLLFLVFPFKFAKALEMAFFTTFLDVKNFLASTVSSNQSPLLLMMDWSSLVHSFVCSKASLAALHTSKSLKDPSKRLFTQFSWCSWRSASCVSGSWTNFSTDSIKSRKPSILWQINDDEEVSSEDLNKVSKCSLHLRMSGCGLEGKLIERPWKLDFEFKGEAAIFFFG